jgi:hypothetical protein
MKRKVFLAVALFALMAVGVYAQTGTAGLKFDLTSDKKGYIVSKGTVAGMIDVVIPASYNNLPVTEIGLNAFDTTNIKSVIIPNSVTKIGSSAFSRCIYLTSVTIGNGVKEIGIQAFNGCPKITSVTFQGTFSTPVLFNTNAGFPGDLRDKYLAGGIGTYTRPDNGTTWTKSASAATTPAAAGTAGLAFELWDDDTAYSVRKGTATGAEVVIPASYNKLPVTAIGSDAFLGYTSLTNITIPNSITDIGMTAFMGCDNLTSVTFQGTIASRGFTSSAFQGLGDLRAKYLAGGIGTYTRPSGSQTWTKK